MSTNRKKQPHIYWINLDRSQERRTVMERQYKKLNAKHTRISAIDGGVGLTKFNIKKSWKCHFATPREYACTISHLVAISTAYQDGRDIALIMEDDMKILRLPTNRLIEAAPVDWEILQLSAAGPFTKSIYNNPDAYFIPWHSFNMNTGGYLINRLGMIKILYMLAPETLNEKDLRDISFKRTKFTFFPFPAKRSCNADYILYSIAKTYTCCDISMYEDRLVKGTIPHSGFFAWIQDQSAAIIRTIYDQRGFLMKW